MLLVHQLDKKWMLIGKYNKISYTIYYYMLSQKTRFLLTHLLLILNSVEEI